MAGLNDLHNDVESYNYALEAFYSDHAFTFSDYYTLGAGASADFVLDPSTWTPHPHQKGEMLTLVPAFAASGGPVTIEIHGGTDSNNDGTVVQAFNRNANTAEQAGSTLRKDPTINNVGTRFSGILVPSNHKIGFGISEELPFRLNTSTKYMVRATNRDTVSIYLGIRWTFFEV